MADYDYTSSYNGSQVDRGVSIGLSSYVPTLQSAPTSSTLTFTLEGDTINFRVGMFCRIEDQASPNGYKFFRLANISSNTATWEVVTLKSGTKALFDTGTDTEARVWSASVLKSIVDDNKIVVYGSVQSYTTSQSFAKNGLVTVNSDEVYVSNAQVTGLPSHVVTDSGEVVTDDEQTVIDGTNTETKWDRIT